MAQRNRNTFKKEKERNMCAMSFASFAGIGLALWVSFCFASNTESQLLSSNAYHHHPRRVLVIGSTGVGKSTLINALAGKNVMDTSPDAIGCTASYATATVKHRGTKYEFVDTVGLNEADGGTVQKKDAIKMFFKFLKENKEGFNLIIFCIRQERLTAESKATYEVMVKKLYSHTDEESPPVLIFVSGLFLGYKDPQDWCISNRQTFADRGFSEVTKGDNFHCISLPPQDPDPTMEALLKKKRAEGTARAWSAVENHVIPKPRRFYKDFKGMMKLGMFLWNALVDFISALGLNGFFQWSKAIPDELASIIKDLGFTTKEFFESVDSL